MSDKADILHEAKRLRLLAAALELQHYTCTAANVVPIPGGERVIAIGTPAQLRDVLQMDTKLASAALCDADHLAEVSLQLLAALNKLAGARAAHEVHDTMETAQQQDQAQQAVSEYWRAVQDAAGEYRKRADRVRKQATLQQLADQAQEMVGQDAPAVAMSTDGRYQFEYEVNGNTVTISNVHGLAPEVRFSVELPASAAPAQVAQCEIPGCTAPQVGHLGNCAVHEAEFREWQRNKRAHQASAQSEGEGA